VAHRWNNYAAVVWKMESRTRLIGTVYVQPRFDRPSDVRVLTETGLSLDVTKRLSVKLTLNFRHDSDPPTGVKASDLEVRNALSVRF
jgi:putative salt-induced outer membrane protein YdiY